MVGDEVRTCEEDGRELERSVGLLRSLLRVHTPA